MKISSSKNYPKSGKENSLAAKPIKTRFSVDYPKSGKNYPNFGKINPLFQKDVKFGKENALQMPYKARYPSFQKCGKEFCPAFDFYFLAIQQHGKNYPKFGKENPGFGKNYPNAAKPFKMENDRTILSLVKKNPFHNRVHFLDF